MAAQVFTDASQSSKDWCLTRPWCSTPTIQPLPAMLRPQCAFWACPAHALSQWALLQETVADELEEAYRGHVWDPSLRHVQKQKQGVTAARVELTSLFTKASPTLPLAQQKPFLPHCISANPGCIVTILHHVESGTCSLLLHAARFSVCRLLFYLVLLALACLPTCCSWSLLSQLLQGYQHHCLSRQTTPGRNSTATSCSSHSLCAICRASMPCLSAAMRHTCAQTRPLAHGSPGHAPSQCFVN